MIDEPRSAAALTWPFIEQALERLVRVAEELAPDGLSWRPTLSANSVASLVAHTLSNAEDNICRTIGGEAIEYLRQLDFDAPPVHATDLRERWDALRPRMATQCAAISRAEELALRRHPRRGSLTVAEILVVVARHSAEHLGQAELTRDLFLAPSSG